MSTITTPSARLLAAWALLAFAGLHIVFEFLGLVAPGGATFSARAAGADFRSLVVMTLPLLAFLVATRVSPPLPGARMITMVSLVEYVAGLGFGSLTLLVGLARVVADIHDPRSSVAALRYLVMGAAALALIAIAALFPLRDFLAARRPA